MLSQSGRQQVLTLFSERFLRIPAGCAAAKILRSQGAYQSENADAGCNERCDDLRVHKRNLVQRVLCVRLRRGSCCAQCVAVRRALIVRQRGVQRTRV